MAITAATAPEKRRARLPFCALVLVSAGAAAAEFDSAVRVGLTRTDNVTLASENEQSETVLQLMPSFNVSEASSRITADAAYRLEAFYYDDRGDSEIYHQFDSRLRAALDPDNFFLDLGASRSQSIRDPEARIPFGNLPISGNRVDRDDIYFGPSFQYPLGAAITARGSLRRTWVRYDDEEDGTSPFGAFRARDTDYDSGSFSLDNYRKGSGFTWAMRYGAQRTEYEGFQPWEHRQAVVELGVWAGEGLRLFASGGKESAWDQPLDPSLEDSFWEAGLAKQLGARFSAEVAAGERTFGSFRRGQLDYTFPRGSMGVSYSEAPSTQGIERFRRGGLLEPDLPDDFLARPGSVERHISKRLQWNLGISLRRTDLSFGLFDEEREQRARLDGVPLGDESQTGANLRVTWQAGRRTEVFFSGTHAGRTFEGSGDRKLRRAALGARFDLGPSTNMSFQYEHDNEDSDDDVSGRRNYRANLVSVFVTRTF